MKLSSIMIVDDSEGDQFYCKALIGKYDPSITILQAYDGQEALELLENATQKPDIILLDINMPRMNGHQFLQAYEHKQAENSTMIVMLTSSDQEIERKKTLAYQFVQLHLLKPLSPIHLDEISTIQ